MILSCLDDKFEIKLTAGHYFYIFLNYCLDMNKIGLIEAKF